jgi:hypothetical protein
MPKLVNPEPRNVRNMERWSAFRERIHAWPLEKMRGRAAQFSDTHFPDSALLRKALKSSLARGDAEGNLADVLILAALRTGELTAFIYLPPSTHCFALERFFWSTFFQRDDALKAVEEGDAPWPLRDFVPQSIEGRLADCPLFVSKAEANAFLKLKPPSQLSIKEASKALVAEYRDAPLKKAQFISLLMARCPGCSANHAGQAWKLYVPAKWRKPGRRRKTE